MTGPRALGGIVILTGLLGYLYYPVLVDLAAQWSTDTTYGYGYYVPGVVAYLIWQRRQGFHLPQYHASWWGYVVVLIGMGALVFGRAGGINLLARVSLIIVLFGLVIFLGGWRLTRLLAFPLVFLSIMIPLPPSILSQLTWPLQLFTARFSTAVLRLVGFPVLLQGIYIDLPTIRLEVAEACSGFRSLIALGATGVLLSYMTQRRWHDRALLIAAVVPIAILANALRVTSNILLGIYEGTFHMVSGWVVFVLATALLLGLAGFLSQRTRIDPQRAGDAPA